jgi:hypothetical protein
MISHVKDLNHIDRLHTLLTNLELKNSKMMTKATSFILSVGILFQANAQQTVLKAKLLIDGTGKIISHPIIVIEDKK